MCVLKLYCSDITVIFYNSYRSRNNDYWGKRGIRGPKPFAFFNKVLAFLWRPLPLLEMENYREYGKIYGYILSITPKPFYNIF